LKDIINLYIIIFMK